MEGVCVCVCACTLALRGGSSDMIRGFVVLSRSRAQLWCRKLNETKEDAGSGIKVSGTQSRGKGGK